MPGESRRLNEAENDQSIDDDRWGNEVEVQPVIFEPKSEEKLLDRRGSMLVGDTNEVDEAQQQSQLDILEKMQSLHVEIDKQKRAVFHQVGIDNPIVIDLQKLLYRTVVNDSPGSMVVQSYDEIRLVFLDVDGVLNCMNNKKVKLLPDKLRLIGRICEEAGAQIVLSTTWREHADHRDELLQALVEVAGVSPHKLLGQTPSSLFSSLSTPRGDGVHISSFKLLVDEPPERLFMSRASQVQAFLGIVEVEEKVAGWVIIDDMDLVQEAYMGDTGALTALRGHFVRTDNMVGITEEQVAEAVAMLSCKEGSGSRGGSPCAIA
jgi:hypothetical protein